MAFKTGKRLIVCCDGTWEDATADSDQPPSNVTRISRALSRTAIVEEDGQTREIPQIVYYQKGVGTGIGDKYFGGVTGIGLSANVRAAYGFLAENYNEGDKIYFFGFSRGAYTARAIAGIVCQLGLLTPRGMDNFTNVYNDFYSRKVDEYSPEKRRQLGFRDPLPRFTVEIVGVWDTPDNAEGQELLQVWFSGVHTDIGGGGNDPRLSNIALAWMVAQCTKYNQLSFDVEGYLFDIPPATLETDATPLWATALGKTPTGGFTQTLESVLGGTSKRTPLAYKQPGSTPRPTYEMIHVSIKDRGLSSAISGPVSWPCGVVGAQKKSGEWSLVDGKELVETVPLEGEVFMKGRIRIVHVNKVD
ncbi:hypothetical protein AOCH_001495 [Aspergillus ochraceoroseus]|uniref:T6SS Phospholipase effector Tle1-like catalytic domain-containing protein n=1 Tax=Aspergillus ochraceoroseus TaxID=138278 RepID=A0A0F8URU5_9EURO|nr:hypothetical protein AOCH_001495 [Aspergillus ochraceoroseus]